jgi:putative acetyltransferase
MDGLAQGNRNGQSASDEATVEARELVLLKPTTTPTFMQIRVDDLGGAEIRALLAEHLHNMYQLSPPESVHALDLAGLLKPDITFWTVWSQDELLGCGALKELSRDHGEIKSMRTASAHRRKGVARAMLQHIIAEARSRSYTRLSLETGSMSAFEPARRLYESFGFTYCAPFADYAEDPNSVFLTRALEQT